MDIKANFRFVLKNLYLFVHFFFSWGDWNWPRVFNLTVFSSISSTIIISFAKYLFKYYLYKSSRRMTGIETYVFLHEDTSFTLALKLWVNPVIKNWYKPWKMFLVSQWTRKLWHNLWNIHKLHFKHSYNTNSDKKAELKKKKKMIAKRNIPPYL